MINLLYLINFHPLRTVIVSVVNNSCKIHDPSNDLENIHKRVRGVVGVVVLIGSKCLLLYFKSLQLIERVPVCHRFDSNFESRRPKVFLYFFIFVTHHPPVRVKDYLVVRLLRYSEVK